MEVLYLGARGLPEQTLVVLVVVHDDIADRMVVTVEVAAELLLICITGSVTDGFPFAHIGHDVCDELEMHALAAGWYLEIVGVRFQIHRPHHGKGGVRLVVVEWLLKSC